ncbi:hypothetical protein M0813_04756 [Anaeramoeba flamelloides]|uniref:Uncharacterized protein n=1 Tax=Anaeramoeba flamelloides TaxID=1746091 RepID=A0ABQ8XIV0_9EUKA|nr:hypothetical protein M0813_04756 [Anaeramoeba flamelloides]
MIKNLDHQYLDQIPYLFYKHPIKKKIENKCSKMEKCNNGFIAVFKIEQPKRNENNYLFLKKNRKEYQNIIQIEKEIIDNYPKKISISLLNLKLFLTKFPNFIKNTENDGLKRQLTEFGINWLQFLLNFFNYKKITIYPPTKHLIENYFPNYINFFIKNEFTFKKFLYFFEMLLKKPILIPLLIKKLKLRNLLTNCKNDQIIKLFEKISYYYIINPDFDYVLLLNELNIPQLIKNLHNDQKKGNGINNINNKDEIRKNKNIEILNNKEKDEKNNEIDDENENENEIQKKKTNIDNNVYDDNENENDGNEKSENETINEQNNSLYNGIINVNGKNGDNNDDDKENEKENDENEKENENNNENENENEKNNDNNNNNVEDDNENENDGNEKYLKIQFFLKFLLKINWPNLQNNLLNTSENNLIIESLFQILLNIILNFPLKNQVISQLILKKIPKIITNINWDYLSTEKYELILNEILKNYQISDSKFSLPSVNTENNDYIESENILNINFLKKIENNYDRSLFLFSILLKISNFSQKHEKIQLFRNFGIKLIIYYKNNSEVIQQSNQSNWDAVLKEISFFKIENK